MLTSSLCFISSLFIIVIAYNQQGDGVWSVIHVESCEDKLDNVILGIKVEKHKVNHTHEAFRSEIHVKTIIDDSFGVFINVCKFVDGGCKHYTNIVDNCLKNFLHKHAEKNFETALGLAGIDPPDMPVSEGQYLIEDFVMDYCELPQYFAYGKYEAEGFIVKDKGYVGCLKVIVEFAQPEEDTC